MVVTNKSKLKQLSVPGGGYAISIIDKKSHQIDGFFFELTSLIKG